MNRLDELRRFVAEEPGDPFNRYALALELLREHEDEAYSMLQALRDSNPEYLPTYYPLAQLYMQRNQASVRTTVDAGVTEALRQRDTKTAQELRRLLQDWEDDQT